MGSLFVKSARVQDMPIVKIETETLPVKKSVDVVRDGKKRKREEDDKIDSIKRKKVNTI
jgi:hypothetical protein